MGWKSSHFLPRSCSPMRCRTHRSSLARRRRSSLPSCTHATPAMPPTQCGHNAPTTPRAQLKRHSWWPLLYHPLRRRMLRQARSSSPCWIVGRMRRASRCVLRLECLCTDRRILSPAQRDVARAGFPSPPAPNPSAAAGTWFRTIRRKTRPDAAAATWREGRMAGSASSFRCATDPVRTATMPASASTLAHACWIGSSSLAASPRVRTWTSGLPMPPLIPPSSVYI
mmetsp:Transcript_4104/g.11684  ORF Transcript_4104/g.11684 Transcript_4104/m.11684 type:complete len:226 (-) Transcript_4104:33-710(-)